MPGSSSLCSKKPLWLYQGLPFLSSRAAERVASPALPVPLSPAAPWPPVAEPSSEPCA